MMTRHYSSKVQIIMREKYGWKLHKKENMKIWICGYQNHSLNDIFDTISSYIVKGVNRNDILKWIKNIEGHFSMIVEVDDWVVALVDKICSYPIFTYTRDNDIYISNHAPILKEKCGLEKSDYNSMAILEIAMSGFTIGNKTLYHNLDRLKGGEFLLSCKGSFSKESYYTYSPYGSNFKTKDQLKKQFTDVCMKVLIDLRNSANGRQIVIPLSAGNDSRLIASGLKKLGVKNVICFSYGRKGNFETPISKLIADKLGYQWIYLSDNMRDKYNFFRSDVYLNYVAEFESYGSIPNVQEVYEISLLKKSAAIDDDAVIVNGNSGDFISGGHVIAMVNAKNTAHSIDDIDWNKFLDKHYSLWRDLRVQGNDDCIVSELKNMIPISFVDTANLRGGQYGIMENLECVGRQSRLVIGQQRAYDYFGYEWRLPLWSDKMLNFWENVPYKYKVDQSLYIEVLRENNWGDVWLDIKVNDKKIKPYILRSIRMLLKILFIPLGRLKWHRFEKNVFEYFMHPSYALTVESYFKILFDYRSYRNTNSWLALKMLKNNDIDKNLKIKK
ncbi:hypothetical protein HOL24_00105 [bacterium]|jgi:asparagine synthase (glutamine-hydrolysing)|nr:hypothetical protein [bacterium]